MTCPVPPHIPPCDPFPDGYVIPNPGPCSGLCLTGHDVGVPIPGTIAYAHPDCPAHGWGLIEEDEDAAD